LREPRSIALEVAGAHHAGDIAAIYAPIVSSTAISFETEPPSLEEMARRIEVTLARYPWLVALVEGKIAGYAYAHAFAPRQAYAWSAETSVYVDSEFRAMGIGRTLYDELLETLRRQGYCRAFAGIALPDAASVALHEATGFTQVGIYRRVGWKMGAWHDVGWWELDLRPEGEPPGRLIPFREIARKQPK
jgi:phosphinothricin acetyltransferase